MAEDFLLIIASLLNFRRALRKDRFDSRPDLRRSRRLRVIYPIHKRLRIRPYSL